MESVMLALGLIMVFVIGLLTGAVLMYEKLKPPVTGVQETTKLVGRKGICKRCKHSDGKNCDIPVGDTLYGVLTVDEGVKECEKFEMPELDDFMKPIEETPKVQSLGPTGYLLETKSDDSSRKYVCSKCGYSFWTDKVSKCPGCKAKLLGVHKYEDLDAEEYIMIFGGAE